MLMYRSIYYVSWHLTRLIAAKLNLNIKWSGLLVDQQGNLLADKQLDYKNYN